MLGAAMDSSTTSSVTCCGLFVWLELRQEWAPLPMAIERELWLKSFRYESLPFPCPTCGTGTPRYKLQTRGDQTHFPLFITASAENHRRNMRHEPASLDGSFVYMAVCDRKECGELICLCGDHEHKAEHDTLGGPTNLHIELKPKFICPAPNIFRIPGPCRALIRDEVRAAFQLFWCDPGACANRIRNAVELVLSDLGIPRFRIGKGRRNRLTLHDRIKLFESKDAEQAHALMALKWLGNAGSHPAGEVSKDDALDGFEILDHVLQERYVQHRSAISRLSRAIIRRRGPRSKS